MRKPICLLLAMLGAAAADCQQFKVSYPATVYSSTFSGRVLLYLSKENKNPKGGFVDLDFSPSAAIDVHDVKPGESVVFDDRAVAFPVPLADLERGEYYVQAVWDLDLGGRMMSASPGNLFSLPVRFKLSRDREQVFSLVCDHVVPAESFTETKYARELRAPSPLLSTFYGKSTLMLGSVVLPREYYTQPGRKFPVLYVITGFGGDYHRYSGMDSNFTSPPIDTIPCITVCLDGQCRGGHSVYANSDNNGPWGDAMTKDLIPYVEKLYRCDGVRLLEGRSSGGWTSLWLQTHYPTMFAGCWASCPDPVDFRSFLKVNLYADSNMFYGKNGRLQQLATIAGSFPVSSLKMCYRQESVIWRGEQMQSFNFVFSPKAADGMPMSICDPVTGAIDKSCFEHWKRYDISAYLIAGWSSLDKDLRGKVRISVGNQDNFLLNYPVHLLDDELKKLGSPFVFAYYPGDHFTIDTPEYFKAGADFLAGRWRESKK